VLDREARRLGPLETAPRQLLRDQEQKRRPDVVFNVFVVMELKRNLVAPPQGFVRLHIKARQAEKLRPRNCNHFVSPNRHAGSRDPYMPEKQGVVK